jgi:hypothetical protein
MAYELNTKVQAELSTDVGIFSRNDAPAPFCGAGYGSLCWFNNYQEMANFFRGFLLHECLLIHMDETEHSKVVSFIEKLAENVESTSPQLEKVIKLYNDAFKGIDQIDWIGTFEQLCTSHGKWECDVREFVIGNKDVIQNDYRESFSDEILTYGC